MLLLAKELLLERWKTAWLCSSAQGHFALANHLALSLKPCKHFALMNRELHSYLIQHCTSHTFLCKCYQRFVPSEDPTCPCGAICQGLILGRFWCGSGVVLEYFLVGQERFVWVQARYELRIINSTDT